jgi:uncharacterized protein DUF1236
MARLSATSQRRPIPLRRSSGAIGDGAAAGVIGGGAAAGVIGGGAAAGVIGDGAAAGGGGIETGYRYAIVNDRPVIVEPRSRRIVQIIE